MSKKTMAYSIKKKKSTNCLSHYQFWGFKKKIISCFFFSTIFYLAYYPELLTFIFINNQFQASEIQYKFGRCFPCLHRLSTRGQREVGGGGIGR